MKIHFAFRSSEFDESKKLLPTTPGEARRFVRINMRDAAHHISQSRNQDVCCPISGSTHRDHAILYAILRQYLLNDDDISSGFALSQLADSWPKMARTLFGSEYVREY